MAISNNTTWEVRTTGNDNNGGGFVTGATGTDFSQQNAAQYTFADLASTNGTTNPSVVTSASHNFVAADVGNIIHITAGTNWTAGFYQIVSVAANAATLDRAVGSAASLSGGTYAVGGALLTVQQALNGVGAGSVIGQSTPGQTVWIKVGTYTNTVAYAFINNVNPSIVVGYDVTRGDNTGNRPLLTTSTNSVNILNYTNAFGVYVLTAFDNINFSSTAGTPGEGIAVPNGSVGSLQMRRCKLSGFSRAININNDATHGICGSLSMLQCEVASCTSDGIYVQLYNPGGNTVVPGLALIFGCYFHNNGNDGAKFASSNASSESVFAFASIFDSNAHSGLEFASPAMHTGKFINCDFTNNTGDGLTLNMLSDPPGEVYNCIFWGNGAFGFNNTGANTPNNVLMWNNAYGNNTSGAVNTAGVSNLTPTEFGRITLTANPFVSATNFALNSTAGGGVLCTGAGYPGPYGSATTASPNVGAIQSVPGASGGFFHQTMGGIIG